VGREKLGFVEIIPYQHSSSQFRRCTAQTPGQPDSAKCRKYAENFLCGCSDGKAKTINALSVKGLLGQKGHKGHV